MAALLTETPEWSGSSADLVLSKLSPERRAIK